MPDLTLETAWVCASNFYWLTHVTGSKGDVYTVWWGRLPEDRAFKVGAQHGWQCDCKGYRFRGTCRHIREVKASEARCGWNAEMEPSAEPGGSVDNDPVCPECGGPVRAIRVAV